MTQGMGQAPDQLVGRTVAGKYKIVRQLGEGGMGCVYHGEQMMGSKVRKVAVKTLHKHLSHDTKIQERFSRECETVAGLEHPNTIQVFDFGQMEDGTLYIVMEYVDGKSVADILEKEGPMPPARVENILRQVCGSLEEAHGKGIVHRDLKPDNVVLCERAGQKDWVEVLDFGIAKRSSEHDPNEAKLTQQGMVLGTPPYMSPEQFTGQPIDSRSDIYSLGIMVYEMLVGKLPFSANTAWEWASKHMTEMPMPFENQPLGAHVPEKMRSAIMRSLAKNPNERFATVREFLEALSAGGAGATAMEAPYAMAGAMGGHGGAPQGPPPGGPAPAPRAMTEMGQPMVGGPMGGPPMGGPPMGGPPMGGPPMGGPPMGGPPSPYGPPGAAPPMYAAAVPAGPSHQGASAKKGGGGLIIGLAVVAVLLLGGAGGAFFLLKPGTKPVDPVPSDNTSTSATTTPTTDPSAAHTAEPTPSVTAAAPLEQPSAQPTAAPAAATTAKPAATPPPTKPAVTPVTPPQKPPVTPPPQQPKDPAAGTQADCMRARQARAQGQPAAIVRLWDKKCREAGGTP